MIKSTHPDVAFWSYEGASRGYFGYHLRARSLAARQKLRQKLMVIKPAEALVLRLGAQLDDPITAGWVRTDYPYLALTRGNVPVEAEGVRLAIPEDSWPLFLLLLEKVDAKGEDSVNAITPSGHVPLWVWWDSE